MLEIEPIVLNKRPADTTVVVAMSGGVDSSTVAVSLALLGYQVIGVTLQLYNGSAKKQKGTCCAGQDIYDAKRIADKFNFPHYVLNYESLFKEKVIDDFVDSYLKGRTPIPCVRCNQTVKFKDLLKVARDLGADALATGHYVRRVMQQGDKVEMHTAKDDNKDQSYFLFTTTNEQLKFLRFPLGNVSKETTRSMAFSLGLDIANKPDSQDICFVQGGSYANLVRKLRPDALKKGKIMHIDGGFLAEHDGVINYTIGQRKGLGVSSTYPLYVVNINPSTNEVIVGPKSALAISVVDVREVNWIDGHEMQDQDIQIEVKLRSGQQKVAAVLFDHSANSVSLRLTEDQFGVAPGQACVFYKSTKVLGGGWIHDSH